MDTNNNSQNSDGFDSDMSQMSGVPQTGNRNSVVVIAVVVVFVLIVGASVWLFLQGGSGGNPTSPDNINQAAIDEAFRTQVESLVAEAEAQPFEYTLVPDAPTSITLPPPPESAADDAASYEALKSQAAGVTPVQASEDVYYYLPVRDTVYGDYLNNLPNPLPIFQMHDELRRLTLQFNEQYNRAPLAERIDGVNPVTDLDLIVYKVDTKSVYPSIRAVDAYAAAEVMSRLDVSNATTYKAQAEALVERGIAYGLYGASDAVAAKELVNQYIARLNATNPMTNEEFISLVTTN